ncbi:metallophosphoesterase family protein [Streptosporangium minutum]|uniref:Metallophosphoesterase n=1 Tax=Streptosporangium minutum TaxID=569862 RepID=A0A243QZ73_9ACTN|nr:metallophosphoesterase [Streptosporangium minutum]OUC87342.1 metallophosphoesterase [Streptosporangium minutum]
MVDVGRAAERGREVSSRVSEEGAGWDCVEIGAFKDLRPSKESFTWLSPRTVWKSRNEVLAGLFGDPSGQVRARWTASQRERGVDPSFRIPMDVGPEFSFLVLGDTGEGDASQYAVIPGLLKLGADTSFAVIASDVIYPTGSGNEYEDKFFRPYKDYRAPIYAVPGNHDWYDGLGGFMRVFCDAPALKAERQGFRLTPSGLRGLLWRKPEKIDEARLARAREHRSLPEQRAVQPAPYWAMETPGLLVVGVDTGIHSTLDREQARWLREVSRDPRPKVLITGKPIYTRNEYKPSKLEDGGTIDDIVADPAHNYVAAIGGDVHNYQRFPIRAGGRTIQYIVAGGSGAFMHATHTIPRVTVGGLHEDDYRCYPLRGDSLSFYSKLYSERLRMRWLYLTPAESATLMSRQIGNTPVRDVPPVRVTRRMRWAARILGGRPMPFRLPVGRVFHRYLSELSDWDTPPFFKSFLHISVTPQTLKIRCFAATGCLPQEIEPPLEDEVVISLL